MIFSPRNIVIAIAPCLAISNASAANMTEFCNEIKFERSTEFRRLSNKILAEDVYIVDRTETVKQQTAFRLANAQRFGGAGVDVTALDRGGAQTIRIKLPEPAVRPEKFSQMSGPAKYLMENSADSTFSAASGKTAFSYSVRAAATIVIALEPNKERACLRTDIAADDDSTQPVEVPQQPNEKFWSQYDTLQWADFVGPVDLNSQYGASTTSGLKYVWKRVSSENGSRFFFAVKSFMSKSESWVRRGRQTSELLNHERLHFDISEFFARKLLENFESTNYTDNYRDEISHIFNKIQDARQAMEHKYDAESDHSNNKAMQLKWEAYVAKLLKYNPPLKDVISN